MTNQVSKEGLTDDQMNEHCHLAITEVLVTPMKKRDVINLYVFQHFRPHNNPETVCQVSAPKN